MKLIVNSTPLIPPLSGIGRYTQYLLKNLLQHPQVVDVQAFNPLRFYSNEALVEQLKALEVDTFQEGGLAKKNWLGQVKQVVKKVPGARWGKKKVQEHIFKKNFQRCQDRIYWEPNYILEPFDGLSVTTIHDLSHIRYPQFHPPERCAWLDKELPKTLEQAHKIVAVSEFSKGEIMDVFGVPGDKIDIVSPAVSDEFRQQYSSETIHSTRGRYKLPAQFILTVATIEPRKNIQGLLEAYQGLPETFKQAYPLVIVGCSGWLTDEIEALMTPLVNKGQVIRLGYVSQQDLPVLYAAATLFVYVSLYEGFGMPVAEAMSSGIPVLTSNLSSMPEVAASCTALADPSNPLDIQAQIQHLLESPQTLERMGYQGQLQAENYTWENSTHHLMQVFLELSPQLAQVD